MDIVIIIITSSDSVASVATIGIAAANIREHQVAATTVSGRGTLLSVGNRLADR